MNSDLASKFADRLAEFAVDLTLDMMADCPSEYAQFNWASDALTDSITSFSDAQLEDYLNDFCESVRAAIKQRVVRVKDITIDGEGFQTATVFIETMGLSNE